MKKPSAHVMTERLTSLCLSAFQLASTPEALWISGGAVAQSLVLLCIIGNELNVHTSVTMSASFFWMSWLAASGRPNCFLQHTRNEGELAVGVQSRGGFFLPLQCILPGSVQAELSCSQRSPPYPIPGLAQTTKWSLKVKMFASCTSCS